MGLYWRRYENEECSRLKLWVCLIPCLPIHVTFPLKLKSKKQGVILDEGYKFLEKQKEVQRWL